MPLFVYPSKYTYKPPLGTRIQRGHTLSTNVSATWLFNEGGGLTAIDSSATGSNGTNDITLPDADVTWTVGQNGICVNRDSTANSNRGTLNTNFSSTTIFTIAAGIFVQSTAANHYHTVLTNTNTAGLWLKGASSSTFNIDYFIGADHLSSTALNINQYYNIVVVVNSGNLTYYYNGVADGTFSGIVATTYTNILSDPSNETLNGNLEYLYFWNRAITAGEVTQLHVNPFTMYQATPTRFVSVPRNTTPTGTATLQDVVGITTSGTVAHTGTSTLQDVVGITTSATVNHTGKITLQDVVSVTSNATITRAGISTLQDIVSVLAKGTVAHTGKSNLQDVVSIITSGTANHTGTATLQDIVSLNVSTGSSRVGSATLQDVVSVTTSGTVNHTGKSTLQDVVSLTSNATVTHTGKSTLQNVVSVTTTSTIKHTGKATLQDVVSIIATAGAGVTSATLQNVVSVTTTSTIKHTGKATLQDVVSVTASGSVTHADQALLKDTVSVSAKGSVTHTGKATLQDVVTVIPETTGIVPGSAVLQDVVSITTLGTVNHTGKTTLQDVVSMLIVTPGSVFGHAILTNVKSINANEFITRGGNTALINVTSINATPTIINAPNILTAICIVSGTGSVARVGAMVSFAEAEIKAVATSFGQALYLKYRVGEEVYLVDGDFTKYIIVSYLGDNKRYMLDNNLIVFDDEITRNTSDKINILIKRANERIRLLQEL